MSCPWRRRRPNADAVAALQWLVVLALLTGCLIAQLEGQCADEAAARAWISENPAQSRPSYWACWEAQSCDDMWNADNGLADLCGGATPCFGPCVSAVRAFNNSCLSDATFADRAQMYMDIIGDCPQAFGCMDDRYANYFSQYITQRDGDCVDSTPPALTVGGEATETLLQVCGLSYQKLGSCIPDGSSTYSDPAVLAFDEVDGNVTDRIQIGGAVDLYAAGEYQRRYSATDVAGNQVTQIRTIRVVASGCTDRQSMNYDPAAENEAGICEPFEFGCTDAQERFGEHIQFNYDPEANTDDCVHGTACTGQEVKALADTSGYPQITYSYANLETWCECADGYSGTHCEAPADFCASSPCVSIEGREGACIAIASGTPICTGTLPGSCAGTQTEDSDQDGSTVCADIATFDGTAETCPLADGCEYTPGEECALNGNATACAVEDAACTFMDHDTFCADLGVPDAEATCTGAGGGGICAYLQEIANSSSTCVNQLLGYYCECDENMRGENCELPREPCDFFYTGCPEDSVCSLVDGVEHCECLPSYTPNCVAVAPSGVSACAALAGDQGACEGSPAGCEYICAPPPEDVCASLPCANGGACLEFRDSFECICPAGYTGHTCTLTSQTCSSGTCILKEIGCMDPSMYTFYPLVYERAGWAVAAVNTHRQEDCVPFIHGCLDDQKYNFDPVANTDNDSCEDFVFGCKDPLAFNFDPTANCGDPNWSRDNQGALVGCDDISTIENGGLCIPRERGCTDSKMKNYDMLANTDDGSCVPVINGCTNPLAFNHQPVANTDDGSCILLGCTSDVAENYDPKANTDDGSCVVRGCTNTRAVNYLETATVDAGAPTCTATHRGYCLRIGSAGATPGADCDGDSRCSYNDQGTTTPACIATYTDECAALGSGGAAPGADCKADARCSYNNQGTCSGDATPVEPSCDGSVDGNGDACALNSDATNCEVPTGTCEFAAGYTPVCDVDANTDGSADCPAGCNTDDDVCETATADSTCAAQAASGERACIGAGDCSYDDATGDDVCETVVSSSTCAAQTAGGAAVCTATGDSTPTCIARHIDACFLHGVSGKNKGDNCKADSRCYYNTQGTITASCLPVYTAHCAAIGTAGTAAGDDCRADNRCAYYNQGTLEDTSDDFCGTATTMQACDAAASYGEAACSAVGNSPGDCIFDDASGDDVCEAADEAVCESATFSGGWTCKLAGACDYTPGDCSYTEDCIVLGCTDPFSFNYDLHANTADGSCLNATLGCIDDSSSNYNALANVDDRSCVGQCVNDLSWLDSDDEGCSRYYLGYCGYEDSVKRCPTICGTYDMLAEAIVCSVDVRVGCDGIAGSGLELDECSVCGGDGSRCATCTAMQQYLCLRVVELNDELPGITSDEDCRSYIEREGGRVLVGQSIFKGDDCSNSYSAWAVSGYDSNTDCLDAVGARTECDNVVMPSPVPESCNRRANVLNIQTWHARTRGTCEATGMTRSAARCDPSTLTKFADESGCESLGWAAGEWSGVDTGTISCRDTLLSPSCGELTRWGNYTSGTEATAWTPGYAPVSCISDLADVMFDDAFRGHKLSEVCPVSCGVCRNMTGPAEAHDLSTPGWFACGERLPCSVDYEVQGCNASYELKIYYGRGTDQITDGTDQDGRALVELRMGSLSNPSVFVLPFTGSWTTSSYITANVHLSAGVNRLTFTDYGGVHFERFELTLIGYQPSTRPSVSGAYDHDIAMSLANGLFGSAGIFQDCNPSCLYNLNDPDERAWEWVEEGQCWHEVPVEHSCLSITCGGAQNLKCADRAQGYVESLCPVRASDVLVPSAYLEEPTNQKIYSAGDGSVPVPPDELGWLMDPDWDHGIKTNGEPNVISVGVYAVNDWPNAWLVEDTVSSASATSLGGKGSWYKPLTGKESDAARACGWQLDVRLRVISCNSLSSPSSHVTVKLGKGDSSRVSLEFCIDQETNDLTLGGGAGSLLPRTFLTHNGAGTAEFHDIKVISQPRIKDGADIYFDGVLVVESFAGSSSAYSVGQSVSWGTGRRTGKSAAHFAFVGWQLMNEVDYPCLSEIGTYEGCVDTRYGNYDPTKTIQLSALSCVDNEPPVITLLGDPPPPQNQTVAQFEYFNDTGASAYDAVEGDYTSDMVRILTRSTCTGPRNGRGDNATVGTFTVLGSVDTAVPGIYHITYTVSDSQDNVAVFVHTVTVVEFDECASAPCQNGATCVESNVAPAASRGEQRFMCLCAPGWTGESCAIDVDECASSPCQSGGICMDSYDNPVGYRRVCNATYVDDGSSSGSWSAGGGIDDGNSTAIAGSWDGGTDWDSSGSSSASGSWDDADDTGSWHDGIDSPQQDYGDEVDENADDADEYGVPYVQPEVNCTVSDPCAPVQMTWCNDSQVCIPLTLPNETQCVEIHEEWSVQRHANCLNYTGPTCWLEPIIAPVDTYVCECAQGFAGDSCDIDVDECISVPCLHGSICTDSSSYVDHDISTIPEPDSYVCICDGTGWQGEHCEVDVDDCLQSPSPCMNGASCVDVGVNAVYCTCAFGWEGYYCDLSIDPCEKGTDSCDVHAECSHTGPGLYNCTCDVGWEFGSDDETVQTDPTGQDWEDILLPGGVYTGGTDCGYVRVTIDSVSEAGDTFAWEFCTHSGDSECTVVDPSDAVCGALNAHNPIEGSTFSELDYGIELRFLATTQHVVGSTYSFAFDGTRVATPLVPTATRTDEHPLEDGICDDADECLSSPCLNGGSCLESSVSAAVSIDAFECICAPGWEGEFCHTDIDECLSAPCQHAAECWDSSTIGIDAKTAACTPSPADKLLRVDTLCRSMKDRNTGFAIPTSFTCGLDSTIVPVYVTPAGVKVYPVVHSVLATTAVIEAQPDIGDCGARDLTEVACENGGGCTFVPAFDRVIEACQDASEPACARVTLTGDSGEDSFQCRRAGSCTFTPAAGNTVASCGGTFNGQCGQVSLQHATKDLNKRHCEDSLIRDSVRVCAYVPELAAEPARCNVLSEVAEQACTECDEAAMFIPKAVEDVTLDWRAESLSVQWASGRGALELSFDELAISAISVEMEPVIHCAKTDVYQCACVAGYSGGDCEFDSDECDSHPCTNGGTCLESSMLQGNWRTLVSPRFNLIAVYFAVDQLDSFHCLCMRGWSGDRCLDDIDECASGPCQHDAVCTDSLDSDSIPVDEYVCACTTGWEGRNCENDVDECSSAPCLHDATCADSAEYPDVAIDSFICFCVAGFSNGICLEAVEDHYEDSCYSHSDGAAQGARCDLDVNECDSNPCYNGAACVDSTDPASGVSAHAFRCLCVAGYSNGICDYDFISQYAEYCAVQESSIYASADPTMTGRCDIDVDECDSSPCANGAVCEDSADPSLGAVHAYRCVCAPGYTNGYCDYPPISGYGPACSVLHSESSVQFTGNCDIDVDECESSPCENGAVCIDSTSGSALHAVAVDDYVCLCGAGYAGGLCDYNFIPSYFVGCRDEDGNCHLDVNECDSRPCSNDAVCEDSTTNSDIAVHTYRCLCLPGYANGVCNYTFITEYSSECTVVESNSGDDGFSGNCDIDVDECASSPCVHTAACSDSTDSVFVATGVYRCTCVAGYASGACDYDFIDDYTDACNIMETSQSDATLAGNCEVDVDECVSDPCSNGAACDDSASDAEISLHAYRCTCAAGYANGWCEYDSIIAEYEAECAVAESSMSVTYTGNCDVDVDECSSSPCLHGSSCDDSISNSSVAVHAYRCECQAGFANGACTYAYAPSYEDLCTVFSSSESARFSGNCDVDVDECASSPCLNGAVCFESSATAQDVTVSPHAFRCLCPTGFASGRCDYAYHNSYTTECTMLESKVDTTVSFNLNYRLQLTGTCNIDVDECASAPCRNGAVCSESISTGSEVRAGVYVCDCAHGWEGDNCQIDTDECAGTPCQNGALCNDRVGSYWCLCRSGWEGAQCTEAINLCTVDENICDEHANCAYTGPGQVACTCHVGWEMADNEMCVDIDECVSMPCQNGGACADSTTRFGETDEQVVAINEYTCTCAEGWQGEHCEHDIDECASGPCQNAGQCYESSANLRGAPLGFVGPFDGCLMKGNNIRDPCESGFTMQQCAELCLGEVGCVSIDYRDGATYDGRCCLGNADRRTDPANFDCGCSYCMPYSYFEPLSVGSYVCECGTDFYGLHCEIPVVRGCMDPTAFNFDPTANHESGDCTPVVFGCLDPLAFNFDRSLRVNTDDGSCIDRVFGCTHSMGVNYDAGANTDDGSCDIDPCIGHYWRCSETSRCAAYVAAGLYKPRMLSIPYMNTMVRAQYSCECVDGYVLDATVAGEEDCVPIIYGCTDSKAENYLAVAHADDGLCDINPCRWQTDTCGSTADCIHLPLSNFTCRCTSPAYEWSPSTTRCQLIPVPGCINPEAFNYNPAANEDDGSCIPVRLGCMEEDKFNYDPTANTNGGCVRRIYGCLNELALNYSPLANTHKASSCIFRSLGCTVPSAINYDPSANMDDGTCVINPCDDINPCHPQATCGYLGPGQSECACDAGFVGDGYTCEIQLLGCTDPTALNYNSRVNLDNGQCVYSSCAGDVACEEQAMATNCFGIATARINPVTGQTECQCPDGYWGYGSLSDETDETGVSCLVWTECDFETQFISVLPSHTWDRECTNLTVCSLDLGNGQYESTRKTPTTDRVCEPISACNSSTQYVLAEPTATSDRVCAPLTVCSAEADEWEVKSPTMTSDRVCATLTQCHVNATDVNLVAAFALDDHAATSGTQSMFVSTVDRECVCNNGYWGNGTHCMPWTSCGPIGIEFESSAPSPVADRICLTVDTCHEHSFVIVEPSATSNIVCACNQPLWGDGVSCQMWMDCADPSVAVETHSPGPTRDRGCECIPGYYGDGRDCTPVAQPCASGTWESTTPSQTRNRECAPWSVCHARATTIHNGTSEADVQCECTPGYWGNGTHCTEWLQCGSQAYPSLRVTATDDRECVCLTGFWSPTGGRLGEDCVEWTVCPANSYEATPGGRDFDRSCACDVGFFGDLNVPTASGRTSCTPWRECGEVDSSFEIVAPTNLTDRICRSWTNCSEDTQFSVVEPTNLRDRHCAELTTCNPQHEYQAARPTPMVDRRCHLKRVCDPIHGIERNATTGGGPDRQCECRPGWFGDGVSCTAWTYCLPELQYTVRMPDPTVDRICANLTVCTDSQYVAVVETLISDRVCAEVAQPWVPPVVPLVCGIPGAQVKVMPASLAELDESLVRLTMPVPAALAFAGQSGSDPPDPVGCETVLTSAIEPGEIGRQFASSFGVGSKCDLRGVALTITLGVGGVVFPGDVLTIRNCSLWNPATGTFIAGQAVVPLPPQTAQFHPSASLKTPSSVGPCSGYQLDASESTGGGPLPLLFDWSYRIENDLQDEFLAAQLRAASSVDPSGTDFPSGRVSFFTDPPPNTVRDRYLLGRTVTFILTVTNQVLDRSSTVTAAVYNERIDVPTVQIRGPQQLQAKNTQSMSISAQAERPGCSRSGTLDFLWRVVSTTARSCPTCYRELAIALHEESKRTAVLHIPPRSLPPGSTTVLEVQASAGDARLNSTARVSVSILSTPLLVKINGGATIRLLARRQPFEIDCASYSSDPDYPSSTLSFAIFCTKLGGDPCSVAELAGSTFDETGGLWSLSAATLFTAEDTGIEYTFTCVASSADGVKSGSASTIVRVSRGDPPAVSIERPSSTVLNAEDKLVLRGAVDDTSSVVTSDLVWKVATHSDCSPLVLDVDTLLTAATDLNLVVRPGALQQGSTYCFKLEATDGDGVTGWAETSVLINENPHSGGVVVEPSDGQSLSTQFNIVAQGWEDDHMPLNYRFRCCANGQMLSEFGHSRSLRGVLAPGEPSTGYVQSIYVEVLDTFGGRGDAEHTVRVAPYQPQSGNSSISNEAEQLLEAAVGSGDVQAVGMLVQAFAQNLNAAADTTGGGRRRRRLAGRIALNEAISTRRVLVRIVEDTVQQYVLTPDARVLWLSCMVSATSDPSELAIDTVAMGWSVMHELIALQPIPMQVMQDAMLVATALTIAERTASTDGTTVSSTAGLSADAMFVLAALEMAIGGSMVVGEGPYSLMTAAFTTTVLATDPVANATAIIPVAGFERATPTIEISKGGLRGPSAVLSLSTWMLPRVPSSLSSHIVSYRYRHETGAEVPMLVRWEAPAASAQYSCAQLSLSEDSSWVVTGPATPNRASWQCTFAGSGGVFRLVEEAEPVDLDPGLSDEVKLTNDGDATNTVGGVYLAVVGVSALVALTVAELLRVLAEHNGPTETTVVLPVALPLLFVLEEAPLRGNCVAALAASCATIVGTLLGALFCLLLVQGRWPSAVAYQLSCFAGAVVTSILGGAIYVIVGRCCSCIIRPTAAVVPLRSNVTRGKGRAAGRSKPGSKATSVDWERGPAFSSERQPSRMMMLRGRVLSIALVLFLVGVMVVDIVLLLANTADAVASDHEQLEREQTDPNKDVAMRQGTIAVQVNAIVVGLAIAFVTQLLLCDPLRFGFQLKALRANRRKAGYSAQLDAKKLMSKSTVAIRTASGKETFVRSPTDFTVEGILRSVGLEKFATHFKALGARQPQDLKDILPSDLKMFGMSSHEKRMFRFALSGLPEPGDDAQSEVAVESVTQDWLNQAIGAGEKNLVASRLKLLSESIALDKSAAPKLFDTDSFAHATGGYAGAQHAMGGSAALRSGSYVQRKELTARLAQLLGEQKAFKPPGLLVPGRSFHAASFIAKNANDRTRQRRFSDSFRESQQGSFVAGKASNGSVGAAERARSQSERHPFGVTAALAGGDSRRFSDSERLLASRNTSQQHHGQDTPVSAGSSGLQKMLSVLGYTQTRRWSIDASFQEHKSAAAAATAAHAAGQQHKESHLAGVAGRSRTVDVSSYRRRRNSHDGSFSSNGRGGSNSSFASVLKDGPLLAVASGHRRGTGSGRLLTGGLSGRSRAAVSDKSFAVRTNRGRSRRNSIDGSFRESSYRYSDGGSAGLRSRSRSHSSGQGGGAQYIGSGSRHRPRRGSHDGSYRHRSSSRNRHSSSAKSFKSSSSRGTQST